MLSLRVVDAGGLSLALLACALLGAGSAGALPMAATATLDWDVVDWPGGAGTLQNSFSNVDGSGVDIKVTFVDSTPASLVLSQSPDVNDDFDPPSSTGYHLFIQAEGNNSSSGVTLTFDFSGVAGVTDVLFNLLDVDAGGGSPNRWTDLFDLSAVPLGGGPAVLPTSVLPVNSSPSWSYDSGTGRITGNDASGSSSDDGTASVSFATPITSLQVLFLNGHPDAGNQWAGLSDISFIPVPEPGAMPLLASGLLLLLVLGRRYC
jgi:hypothetical protein